MNTNLIKAAVVIALGTAALPSVAATTSTNVGVTTTVIANCTVTSSPIAFGSYDSLAAGATTATGALQLTCSQGTTPSVAVGLGGNALATQRRMVNAGNYLPYNVLQPTSNAANAACTGATTDYPSVAPGFALTAAPSTAARTFNLCGSIAPGVSVPIGAYSDTVLATITF
ncbi:spore coat protein U domain-containing protein [Usitatibacter palustris]|uniref:Spore coat protein U/FanG domain-containing protein n=1 Tax=Usitatibacter palustris TaxID=2732487 RepID=A0A6M4H6M1_9PROT|nr:spore coat protein U domain-containing protein [Usitatibacter palustris]QJR14835.1 hypothetical protein DSM104440_01648 [Usitatibacter palustris]